MLKRTPDPHRHAIVLALALVLAILLPTLALGDAGDPGVPPEAAPRGPHAQIIVGFEDGLPEQLPDPLQGTQLVRTIPSLRALVVEAEPAEVEARIERTLQDPGVAYAERNGIAMLGQNEVGSCSTPCFEPNDPRFHDQVNLGAVRLPEAWAVTNGSKDVDLFVLDTGVESVHLDLLDNVCGVHSVLAGSETGNHGTHVAGIAAAVTNNSFGVAGASQSCLHSVRVCQVSACDWASIAAGLVLATDLGADIISMSFGGSDDFLSLIQTGVEYASAQGVVLVSAVHNHGCGAVTYPGAFDEVIAVAALSEDGSEWAPYSNCGPEVHIAAPGSNILSTYPGLVEFSRLSGTSMATPLVSGIVALALDVNGTLTHDEVACLLTATADPTGLDTTDPLKIGAGRVDALAMVQAAAVPTTVGC